MSAKLKLKLTALEGSRVRRVSVSHFSSCRAEDYGEHHLVVLTNLGDIQVVSLPLLKPQVRYSCIRREDVSGIASCVFTKQGQGRWQGPAGSPQCGAGWGAQAGLTAWCPTSPPGFYLISPSEFERFSLSTKWLVEPRCVVGSVEAKSHSPPGNGAGLERALGQARWVKAGGPPHTTPTPVAPSPLPSEPSPPVPTHKLLVRGMSLVASQAHVGSPHGLFSCRNLESQSDVEGKAGFSGQTSGLGQGVWTGGRNCDPCPCESWASSTPLQLRRVRRGRARRRP